MAVKFPRFDRLAPSAGTTSLARDGDRTNNAGHQAVLDHLDAIAAEQPLARPRLVGGLLFEMVCRMITTDRGVRVEDLLAILASNGGFSCVLAALAEGPGSGRQPPNHLTIVEGKDGHRYFFGDVTNRYMIESEHALLSLALGAAQSCGGAISTDMVLDTMRHVAGTVGGEDFGIPRLAEGNMPGDLPINYVRSLWPTVRNGLALYEVPAAEWPTTIGFALQRAIEAGKDAIDPALAARIVTECAAPMAKIDPERLA